MPPDNDEKDKALKTKTRSKQSFDVPTLGDKLTNPDLQSDAMAHSKPFESTPEIQQGVGFPGPLIDNWQQVAVEKLGELVDSNRGLQVYLDTCVKCGACTDTVSYTHLTLPTICSV